MTTERDDVEYWDSLASRVTADVLSRSSGNAINWLAQSPLAWVMTCLLAAASFALAVRAGHQSENASLAIAPIDAVGKTMVSGVQPPSIAALLFEQETRGRR